MGLVRKTSWGEVKLLGSAPQKNGSYGIILLSFLFSFPSGHEENEFLPITHSSLRPKHKGLPEHSLKPPILWPKMALLSLYTGLSQTFCDYNRTAPKQQQLICVLFCFEIRFRYVPQASLASPPPAVWSLLFWFWHEVSSIIVAKGISKNTFKIAINVSFYYCMLVSG